MDILPVFCDIDDFCLFFEPMWKRRRLGAGERRRDRPARLCLSEVMTIIVLFHSSSYRNFKAYYTEQVNETLRRGLPAPGQLPTLRRTDAGGAHPAVRLLADPQGALLRY